MKALFNFLIKDDLVATNPVSRVKFLPEDNEQMRVLSFEEQRRYFAVASQSLRDIAVLMLETGMRPEEVYRIRKENVHLSVGYLFNPYGKTKAAKRWVELTAEVERVLADRAREAAGPYLFPHQDDPNVPIPKINNAHDRAVRLSGVRHFRLYDLRHTLLWRGGLGDARGNTWSLPNPDGPAVCSPHAGASGESYEARRSVQPGAASRRVRTRFRGCCPVVVGRVPTTVRENWNLLLET